MHFFNIFHSISFNTKDIYFAPFGDRSCGLEWFTRPIFSTDTITQANNVSIRSAFLCWQMLVAGLLSSTDKSSELYLPNAVARQFGFCQAIPAPFSSKAKKHIINGHLSDMGDLVHVATKNERYKQHFLISEFTPYRVVSKDFVKWWTQYYQPFHMTLKFVEPELLKLLFLCRVKIL